MTHLSDRGKHRIPDEIPTSSMADIAFLLIIFFMVTAAFAGDRGLDFSFPKDEPARTIETVHSVLVRVKAHGGLEVDRKPMGLDGLLPYLEPILKQNPTKPVILQTDDDASYGAMITVFDTLRQAPKTLGLPGEIQISLPSKRETSGFWY